MLTGFSHSLNVAEAARIIAGYHQAALDPQFAGKGYDPGYMTTQPGTRAWDFHAADNVDPQVLAVDEETKDVFAPTEYLDGLPSTLPPMTNRIAAPVLVVNGSSDRLCDKAVCENSATLYAAEAPYFSSAAILRAFVLPGSGHSVNLARNTAAYQAAVRDWVDSTVG